MRRVPAALVDVVPARIGEVLRGAVGEQPLAQRRPVADVRQQHLAIAAATDAEGAVPVQRALAHRRVAMVEPLAGDMLEHRRGTFLQADVHQPAAAVLPPRPQRQQRAERRVQTGTARRLIARQAQRRRTGMAVRPHHAAGRLGDQLAARPLGARPREPERRHRHPHQPRPLPAAREPLARVPTDHRDVRPRQRLVTQRPALDLRPQSAQHLDRKASMRIGRIENPHPL